MHVPPLDRSPSFTGVLIPALTVSAPDPPPVPHLHRPADRLCSTVRTEKEPRSTLSRPLQNGDVLDGRVLLIHRSSLSDVAVTNWQFMRQSRRGPHHFGGEKQQEPGPAARWTWTCPGPIRSRGRSRCPTGPSLAPPLRF